jgi:hypothetical protein
MAAASVARAPREVLLTIMCSLLVAQARESETVVEGISAAQAAPAVSYVRENFRLIDSTGGWMLLSLPHSSMNVVTTKRSAVCRSPVSAVRIKHPATQAGRHAGWPDALGQDRSGGGDVHDGGVDRFS